MKIKNNILYAALGLLFLMVSCEETDKNPPPYDVGLANVPAGAYLKTLSLDAPIDLFDIANATFDVNLEANDGNNGELLQNVEVYLSFIDNTTEGGNDISVAEALYETIPASEFSSANKPVLMYSDPANDALSFLNLTANDLDGTDVIQYRFKVNLTNGQSFSNNNTNPNIISEAEYNSPFVYSATIVCLLDETLFTGTYVLTTENNGPNGATWGESQTVTLSVGSTSTKRKFSAVYLPQFNIGNGPAEFELDLVCGKVIINDNLNSGLGCGGTIFFGPPKTLSNATFDASDDSVLLFNFEEDTSNGCGPGSDVTGRLTKQ